MAEPLTDEELELTRAEDVVSLSIRDRLLATIDALQAALKEARQAQARGMAAVEKYGTHGSGCLAHGWKRGDNEYRCNCGLDAALSATGWPDVVVRAREMLAVAIEWRDKLAANPSSEEAWEALVGEDGCLDNDSRTILAELGAGERPPRPPRPPRPKA